MTVWGEGLALGVKERSGLREIERAGKGEVKFFSWLGKCKIFNRVSLVISRRLDQNLD